MNIKSITGLVAASAVALSFSAGIARADEDRPALSANVALSTDYVFRGISQTDEHAAISGGFDATYKMFYAGVWASNLDFGADANGNDVADIEIDIYGGIKHTFNGIEADLGVIYYAYPDASDAGAELDYVEIKFGLSGNLTENVGLSGTVYWSPDYTGETDDVVTYEGAISVALGTYNGFSPTFTALVGYVDFLDNPNQSSSYAYWNAGVEFGFAEKFTLDLRYHDTDIDGTHPFAADTADGRFVATVSASF